MMRRHTFSVCLVAVGLLGCGRSASTSVTTADQAADYQSSHGIAAHHPESFAAAVEQLATRYKALMASLSDNSPVDATIALQELKDIVRWLPELAGDSDLRRADWEQVQRLTLDLQQRIEPWQTANDAADPGARNHYEKIVAELRPLAEKSVEPISGQ